MKVVRIEKDLIVDRRGKYQRALRAGEQYMFSDMRMQQLTTMFSDYIGTVTDIRAYYKQYKGEDLNNKTILVWRHGGIGDLMFMMPPLRLLKNKYPRAKIMVATGTEFLDTYMNVPYIDVLMPMPINARHFLSADYHLKFEGIIENNINAEHVNAYDLFLERFGFDPSKVSPNEKRPDIFLTDKENKFAEDYFAEMEIKPEDLKIGVQVQASSPIRTYPIERVNALARGLVVKGAFVVLFGGPRQQQISQSLINHISEMTKTKNRIVATSTAPFSLRQSMAIARHMDLVIAPDSAIVHIAAGLGVPIIGLYGPFPSTLRMKYYYNAIGLNAATACSPCFTHGHDPCARGTPSPCFGSIDIPTILGATDFLLKKTGNHKLPDMELVRHSEFNKVIDYCLKYMNGIGVDYGSGYTKYPDGTQIARVDFNPICEPDICADFSMIQPSEEKADFVVSSFTATNVENLRIIISVAKKTLKPEGYLILYMGDKRMVSVVESRLGRLQPLMENFLSVLVPEDIIEAVACNGFELVYSLSEFDKWQDDLYDVKEPEKLNYGFLSIWQKQVDTSK